MEVAGGHGFIISGVGDNPIECAIGIMAGPRVTAGHHETAGEAGSNEFGWNEEEEEAGGSTDHSHQGHKHPGHRQSYRHARKCNLISNLKFPILSATKPASGGPMISATGITPLTNAT